MPTLYYQLVYTLMNMLPPPLDDTAAALRARNLTAIAKIAALAPVAGTVARPAAASVAAPTATPGESISKNEINSHDMAFETWLNAHLATLGTGGPGETDMSRFLFSAARPTPQGSETEHTSDAKQE